MAALASGIFGLTQGDPTAKEEGELGGLGSYETSTGEGLTTSGAKEEEDILSGDPTKIAQAEAPEIKAQQGQVEQQNLQNSNFGNRGGGTNASTQNAEGAGRSNIIDLTGGLIGKTAGEAVGQGSSLLGQATSNINDEASLAATDAANKKADVGDIGKGAAQIAADVATGGAAEALDKGGGADKTPGADFGAPGASDYEGQQMGNFDFSDLSPY